MRVVTMSEITSDIQLRYDLPFFSTTTRITFEQVTRLINLSLQQFYAMLCEAYGDDYFVESYTLTTSPGVGISSLPADFYKLKSVTWRKDTQTAVRVQKATVDQLATFSLEAQSWDSCTPRYRLTTQALQWAPAPSGTYTVDLWYVPIMADLRQDGDAINDDFSAGPGWDEWIVLDVCRRIAESEQKDISGWVAMRNDVEKRIRDQAPDRDESESLQVRDVDNPMGQMGHQAVRDWLTQWG